MRRAIVVIVLLWWPLIMLSQPVAPVPQSVAGSAAHACEWNLGTYHEVLTTPPPTRVHLSTSRYWDVQSAAAGYRDTGIALIGKHGNAWRPAAGLDDVGIYYLIPKLMMATGWTLNRTIDVFFAGMLGLGLIGGAIGMLLCFRSASSRSIAILALLALAAIVYRLGDVHIAYFTTAAIVTPWFLYFSRQPASLWLPVALVLCGVTIGMANYIRTQSGTAALIFVLGICLFGMDASRGRKTVLLLCLLAGMLAPTVLFQNALANRERFLANNCQQYFGLPHGHPFWHSIYTGFGYLQNDLGIRWDDINSYEQAQALIPGIVYGSSEYERVLRGEVLSILRHHPLFAFMTLASKAGVVLCLILLFANLGLPAALLWPKPWPIELSFWAAIAFSALFGLLVNPAPVYMVGLISFATLYGVVSIAYAIESRQARKQQALPVTRARLNKAEVLISCCGQ